MNKDKQIEEMRYLADKMGEAISNEYKRRVLEDERKLEAVLKENGWRKASEVAREIFEEIEKYLVTGSTFYGQAIHSIGVGTFAKLKKKYESEKD